MRGFVNQQQPLFVAYDIEERIPQTHPIRVLKHLADEILSRMQGRMGLLYHDRGQVSIPPEQLLKALVLEKFFSIRSHRQLMEQIRYNLLFQWFLDLKPHDRIWDHSSFSRNQERLASLSAEFFDEIVLLANEHNLLSNEHFTVDGTLYEACASIKRMKRLPKDPPGSSGGGDNTAGPQVDFRGQTFSNQTHRNTTDPDARLIRKGRGKEAKLVLAGNNLVDNRHGLTVETQIRIATGKSEAVGVIEMIDRLRRRRGVGRKRRITVGADKLYDQKALIRALRERTVTPHVDTKACGGSRLLDARTYGKKGYAISLKKRKAVEPSFGWAKTYGGMGKLRHRGVEKVATQNFLTQATRNLVRMTNLLGAAIMETLSLKTFQPA